MAVDRRLISSLRGIGNHPERNRTPPREESKPNREESKHHREESRTTPSGNEYHSERHPNRGEWYQEPPGVVLRSDRSGIKNRIEMHQNRPEWYQEPIGVVSRTASRCFRTFGEVTKTSLPQGSESRSER